MKFLVGLAWKNLSRYRRRTLITALSIAFGLGLFIWIDSMLLGLNKESERNLRWFETGSGKVILKEYEETMKEGKLEHLIPDPRGVSSLLDERKIPHTYRASFAAEAVVNEGSLFVKATAIDPDTDGRVYRFQESVVEGRFIEGGELSVVLGDSVAKSLGLEIGDFLAIRSRTAEGFNQAMDVEVVGILDTPNPYVDKAALLIPLDVADELLFLNGGVTEISLDISETADATEVITNLNNELKSRFPELKALSWMELAKDFLAFAEAKTQGSSVILFLVFIIAAVGISNTMLMAIFERVREIGMMRAQGMKDWQIRVSFLLESAGIGLLGAIAGVLLGVLLTFWIVNWGINVSGLLENMDTGYRMGGVMYGAWSIKTIVTAFFAGILLAVAAAALPTRNAIRMEITDALRHN